jgi:protein-tyrosine kinase
MSRIHEALKKAEQERITLPVPDAPGPHSVPLESDPAPAEYAAAQSTFESKPSVTEARPPAFLDGPRTLRLEDLVANCTRPRWLLDPNVNVFSNSEVNASGAEQFRTLRSRLYHLRDDQHVHTLLITSAGPGEGKTFVASNLAQAIVRQPDRRVLLIDADLRRARLHVPFGAPPAPGLAEYLRGEVDEAAVMQCGGEDNLFLIPGGDEVANPSELLSNGRLATLLNRVGPLFDWVLLDSPPCLPVADASILANSCDAVLFVVRAGTTPSEVAQRAVQELQGRHVAGVVLNAIEEIDGYGAYYYQAYGYSAEAAAGH